MLEYISVASNLVSSSSLSSLLAFVAIGISIFVDDVSSRLMTSEGTDLTKLFIQCWIAVLTTNDE